MEDITKLTLEVGNKSFTVQASGGEVTYVEFMEMFEALLTKTNYSKSEIEDYILMWAADIKATWEN